MENILCFDACTHTHWLLHKPHMKWIKTWCNQKRRPPHFNAQGTLPLKGLRLEAWLSWVANILCWSVVIILSGVNPDRVAVGVAIELTHNRVLKSENKKKKIYRVLLTGLAPSSGR